MNEQLLNITEVERFRYHHGDRFILHYKGGMIDPEQAAEIVSRFRAVMQLPEGVPVAIIDDDWEIKIVEDE